MYYSSGNYEAFAHPRKPEGVDNKSAYIVGSGLAALTAACYLVRDGQMKGERVHILEKGPTAGGACDGWRFENIGYVMRGGREKFMSAVSEADFCLSGDDSTSGALALLRQAQSALEPIRRLDDSFEELYQRLEAVYSEVYDLAVW